MHTVVKITRDENGEDPDRGWCLVSNSGGSAVAFCTGEAYGFGEGDAEGDVKTLKRGGITCPDCLEEIKIIKSVRL